MAGLVPAISILKDRSSALCDAMEEPGQHDLVVTDAGCGLRGGHLSFRHAREFDKGVMPFLRNFGKAPADA
jgi:hypothetical protein